MKDGSVWTRVASDGRYGDKGLAIQFADGQVRQFPLLAAEAAQRQWRVRLSPTEEAALRYSIESDGSLLVVGTVGHDQVTMQLRRVDMSTLPLFR